MKTDAGTLSPETQEHPCLLQAGAKASYSLAKARHELCCDSGAIGSAPQYGIEWVEGVSS